MWEKTFSQKAARIFEIIGYIMLVPSAFGLFWALIGFVMCLTSGSVGGALVFTVPFIASGLGITLLIGYYKHSRGLLAEEKIMPLWIGTFLFNLVPLVSSLYWLYTNYSQLNFAFRQADFGTLLIPGSFIFWWATAVFLSVRAFFNQTANQKYR